MRKKFKKIVAFLCLLVIIPVSIYAIDITGPGSTGDSTSGDSVGNGQATGSFYYQMGGRNEYTVASYRYDLVYFFPNNSSEPEVLSTVIALGDVEANDTYKTWGINRSFVIKKLNNYL